MLNKKSNGFNLTLKPAHGIPSQATKTPSRAYNRPRIGYFILICLNEIFYLFRIIFRQKLKFIHLYLTSISQYFLVLIS